MLDLQYIALGFMQGFTEFLPISSSAHLILLSEIFDWSDQGLFNDIAVHAGTLASVVVYLRKELVKIFCDFLLIKRLKFRHTERYALKIIVATLPALLVGFFVYKYFISDLRNLTVIAYASIFFGIVLYCVDRFSSSTSQWQDLSFIKAFIIGIFQSFAFIPGASRAGIVITGSRMFGLRRDSAAIFSMLLSIPIILASIFLAAYDAYYMHSLQININQAITSTAVAFFTALASIHFMMKILKRSNFTIFIVYRILLGIIILVAIN